MSIQYAGQGAPSNGTSGTRASDVYFGDYYYDVTNGIQYQNTSLTPLSPTWTKVSALNSAGNSSISGSLTVAGATVNTPDTTQVVTVASTIAVDASLILISSASALTITAHPAIATSGVATGTRIIVKNTNASNAITLTDDGTDSGSKIKVRSSTTIAMAAGLTYQFVFDGTNWIVT